MIPARQSTALELAIGPILDADGVAVTGGVVGDLKIKKTTGNFAALNGSATLTHVSAGVYDLVLTTSDTDTVGLCTIAIDDTTNACASIYLQVMEEAAYDMLYAASATGYVANQPVDVNTIKTQTVTCGAGVTVLASVGTAATSTAQTADHTSNISAIKAKTDSLTFTVANVLDANTLRVGGTPQTARDIGASVLLSPGTGTGQISLTSGVVTANVTQFNGATTLVTRLSTIFVTSYATVFDAVNAVLNANITHINSAASSAVALDGMAATYDSALGLPCSDFTAAGSTAFNSLLNARLVAYGLDHLVSASVTGTDIVDNSIIARLVSKSATADWDTYDQTTDSHEALRDRGDAAWITATGFSTLSQADIRTAVGLASANLDTQLSTIDGIVDDILVDTAEIGAAGAGLTNINLPNQTMDIVGNITGTLSGTVGGIAGTITTLDALDTAQDTQHGTTQAATTAIQADLPARITKNTALSAFMFKMVDATDHNTAETGLTVTATRSLDGAAFAACANAVSEVSNGWYKIDLAAADLNGNVVVLRFTASGADTTEYVIVTQNT